jgi:two-component system OmpR family response regulator
MNRIRKALVVDDDDDVLRLCKVSLQTFTRWKVDVASDAAGALGAARREPPDVILLDVMMPDGGGLAIMGQLKGESATAGIPVVLMTAADSLDPDGALGAAGVIQKPFDPAALPEQILRIMERRSP